MRLRDDVGIVPYIRVELRTTQRSLHQNFQCTPPLISHAPLGRASFPPGEAKGRGREILGRVPRYPCFFAGNRV